MALRLLAELAHSDCPAAHCLANAVTWSYDPSYPSSFSSNQSDFKFFPSTVHNQPEPDQTVRNGGTAEHFAYVASVIRFYRNQEHFVDTERYTFTEGVLVVRSHMFAQGINFAISTWVG